jgi:hypothetical protein
MPVQHEVERPSCLGAAHWMFKHAATGDSVFKVLTSYMSGAMIENGAGARKAPPLLSLPPFRIQFAPFTRAKD